MKAEGFGRSRRKERETKRGRGRQRESLKWREEQAEEKETELYGTLFGVACTPSLPQRVEIASKDALEVL